MKYLLVAAIILIVASSLLVSRSTLALIQAQAQGQPNNINVFVVVSPTTYQLDLKAIEGEIPATNFVIKPQSVVQVKQGNNLVVVTQPINQVVESVKVQDASGVIKNLVPAGNNAYSLAGLPTGPYILDVVVDLGSNKKGTYETILVILAQGQQPIPPQQIINQFRITFEDRSGNQTGSGPKCDEGEELIDGKCEPIECEEGYALVGDKCEPIPCEEDTPPGQICRDPGDCEPGYVDRGNGCEPEILCPPVCENNEDLPTPSPSPEPGPIGEIPDIPDEGEGDQDQDQGDGEGEGDDSSNDNSGDGSSDQESEQDQDPPFG